MYLHLCRFAKLIIKASKGIMKFEIVFLFPNQTILYSLFKAENYSRITQLRGYI